jgi:hypothetical protein
MLEHVNKATESKTFNLLLDLKVQAVTTVVFFIMLYLFKTPAREIWELVTFYFFGSVSLSTAWVFLTCRGK